MAETNPSELKNEPSSRSDGIEDHKVSPMRNQGEDQTENNQSQAQQKIPNESSAETPPSNAIPMDGCCSWYVDITKDEPESPGSKMPKVPENLRNSKNEKSYRPLVVSIGPYHHPCKQSETEDGRPKDGEKLKAENDHLKAIKDGEKLKAKMANQFVQEIGKKDKGKSSDDIWKDIKVVAEKAKGQYDEDLVKSFGPEHFTHMMSIDGCFIVHFIYYFTRKYDKLEMSDHKAALVKRDLLLLENQLPYVVLDTLRNMRFGKDQEKSMFNEFLQLRETQTLSSMWVRLGYYFLIFIRIISCCCCRLFSSRGQPSPPPPPEKKKDSLMERIKQKMKHADKDKQLPAHLLELLYSRLIPAGPKEPGDTGNRGHYLYYCAKDLKKVGIRFRQSTTNALTDVKFRCSIFTGTLELPPINIDKYAKSTFLNLVAYESSAVSKEKHSSGVTKKKHWFASYICFMDSLINDAEDVKELRSKGILYNYLGSDQDVADIFNTMSGSLQPEASAYNDVKKKINAQCESVYNKWVAQWVQDYFSSPWAFLALVGAVFTIFLTAVATYAAIWPINKG